MHGEMTQSGIGTRWSARTVIQTITLLSAQSGENGAPGPLHLNQQLLGNGLKPINSSRSSPNIRLGL
jgi:hypothetical protein